MFTKAFLLLSFVLARTTNIVTAFLPTLPSWPSTTTTRRSMVLREEYFQPHFHESTSSSILSETVVDRIMECAASTNDLCDVDEINRLVEGTFCCVGSTGRSGRSVGRLVGCWFYDRFYQGGCFLFFFLRLLCGYIVGPWVPLELTRHVQRFLFVCLLVCFVE